MTPTPTSDVRVESKGGYWRVVPCRPDPQVVHRLLVSQIPTNTLHLIMILVAQEFTFSLESYKLCIFITWSIEDLKVASPCA